jgi:hypothetical protein
MKSENLQQELEAKQAQRERTMKLRDEAQSTLDAATDGFNRGDVDADRLTTASARVLGMDGALHKLNLEIAGLESDLSATLQSERIQAGHALLCDLAQRGNDSFGAYLESIQSAQSAIEDHANAVRSALAAHRDLRLEFRAQLTCTPALASNLEELGADVSGISVPLGGISITQFDRGAALPTSPFDAILNQALVLAEFRDPAIIAEKQAEADERQRLRREDREANERIAQQRAQDERAEEERLKAEEAANRARVEAAMAEDLAAGRTRAFV